MNYQIPTGFVQVQCIHCHKAFFISSVMDTFSDPEDIYCPDCTEELFGELPEVVDDDDSDSGLRQ